MKRIITPLAALFIFSAQAQNVGINATGSSPANAAALDIDMANKGLLIPRVALTTTAVFAPVTGTPVTSLLVYNTATAGVSPTNVIPGYYYWDGSQWVRMANGNSATNDWQLLGNANTNSALNFLGTTDNVDLIFRRNNTQSGYLGTSSTSFGVGARNASSTAAGTTAIGVNALAAVTTSLNNTAVGNAALQTVTTFGANTSVGARSIASNNGPFNCALGAFAMENALNTWSNIAIGAFAMRNATSGSSNIAIGQEALNVNNNTSNIAIGDYAGRNSTGARNVSIGLQSFDIGGGNDNVSVGYNANMFNGSGDNNVIIGSWQLTGWTNGTYSDNVIIGRSAGGPTIGNRNIFIGKEAGYFENGDDKLYIQNSATTQPLIYGDFALNILRTYGTLQVRTPGAGGYAFPTSDGTSGQVLTTNGSGDVTWQNASASGNDWSLIGNAGTNPASNFLGTTDAQDFVIRTNNAQRVRIDLNGFIGMNAAPSSWARLYVEQLGASPISAIWGVAQAFGSAGVVGSGGHVNGYGVFGDNSASGPGVFGISTATNSATRSGVIGASLGGTWIQLAGYNQGGAFSGQVGVSGYSLGTAATNRFAGAFIYDTDNNASTNDANSPIAQLAGYSTTQSIYYGGYFAGGQDYTGTFNGGNVGTNVNAVDYAYVGTRIAGTNYKIVGNGSVSTIIDGENEEKHIMFAPEAPEILFQDFGIGQLVNGEVSITIDPIVAKNIFVDEKHPLKVFIQLKGDCKGVYVTAESANGFTVKELQGGNSNVAFSYQIVANRADRIDSEGNVLSKHVDVRLPKAPGALEQLKGQTNEVKINRH